MWCEAVSVAKACIHVYMWNSGPMVSKDCPKELGAERVRNAKVYFMILLCYYAGLQRRLKYLTWVWSQSLRLIRIFASPVYLRIKQHHVFICGRKLLGGFYWLLKLELVIGKFFDIDFWFCITDIIAIYWGYIRTFSTQHLFLTRWKTSSLPAATAFL